MKTTTELYKCAILTVIAALLLAIFLRMPPAPLTLQKVRASNIADWESKVPLIGITNADGPAPSDP